MKWEDKVCKECKTVHTSKEVCDECSSKPYLTEKEGEYMNESKKTYNKCRHRYDKKKKTNPNLDRTVDEDYLGMREAAENLRRLGQEKNMWVWDDVNLYGCQ